MLDALVNAGTLDCVGLLREGALGSLGNAAANAASADFEPASPELAFVWCVFELWF